MTSEPLIHEGGGGRFTTNTRIGTSNGRTDGDGPMIDYFVDPGSDVNKEVAEKLTRQFQERWVASGVLGGATVVICRSQGVAYRAHFGGDKPDSLYLLISLTKLITTIAILQLQESGRLRIEDPVSKHLPSFRQPRRKGRTRTWWCCCRRSARAARDAGVQRAEAWTEFDSEIPPLTIRHLLNHTSGLSYPLLVRRRLWTAEEETEACSYLQKQRAGGGPRAFADEYQAKSALLFRPGSHFNYAGGHNVAASIVESVTGMPFHEYVHDNILAPLGMSETGFLVPAADKNRQVSAMWHVEDLLWPLPSAVAWVLRRVASKMKAPRSLDTVQSLSHVRGDTGIKGCVSDWIRLNQMLLNGGTLGNAKILSPESVDVMCSSSLPGGAELVAPFAIGAPSADEALQRRDPHFGVRCNELQKYRPLNSYPGQTFGLGVWIVQDAARSGLNSSAMGTCWCCGLASTFLAFNRKADVGCLVFGHDVACWRTQAALADVINSAHELLGA